ncbi:Variant surface glycoprotein [Trypanosoma congolense IL3000]|uniref:Variant surface glycoprotein n=1 Tax=Trypanosoma congolense (strain IL3000) TaxID=1068625 RepID=F9WCR5_TRYCI|nr:Variant surface glycoprotein [Trypanosoma congolense IL3000]
MHLSTAMSVLLLLFTRLLSSSEAVEIPRNRAEFSALCWFWRIGLSAEWALKTDHYKHLSPASFIKHRMLVEWLEDDGNNTPWALDSRLSAALWYLNETEREAAQNMLEAFNQKKKEFAQLEKAIQQKADEARRVLETVRDQIQVVRYGSARKDEPSESWINDAYTRNTRRVRACTMKGSLPGQPRAGSSLVNDLLCLCIAGSPRGGDNNDRICGVELDQKYTWTDRNGFFPYGMAESAWNQISEGCGKVQLPTDLTVENLQSAIHLFENLLGNNTRPLVPGNDLRAFQWVLGYTGHGKKATPISVCSASSNKPDEALGQCVNYANATGGRRGTIAWLQAFQDIVSQVRLYEALHHELEGLDQQVQALSRDLEEAFEEAGFSYQAPRKPHGLLLFLWLLI